MTDYIRVGNQTVTIAEYKTLTKADVDKIKESAARAEQIRKDNIAASLGLKPKGVVADIRPGSELSKAVVADKAAAVAEAENVQEESAPAPEVLPETETKKSKGKK